jgi:tRNA modification GTPase
VQLTPPGRGAVATLLVEGPDALFAAEELLRPKSKKELSLCPIDRPIFAHFGDENGEEVVVWLRRGCHRHPASERGGDEIRVGTSQHSRGTPPDSFALELHCHGGFAAVQTIEKAFIDRGFSPVAWMQWAAATESDPFAAAALAALADACTERTAAILLDQYQGALRTAFDGIERRTGFQPVERNRKSARTDDRFAAQNDEDRRDRQVGNLSYVNTLLERAHVGLHLTNPWRVVLAGAPNVGKSSLLNALAGYPRAIVHHTPGTTRDVVTVRTAFEGWPVELCDTAGLRADNRLTDSIEQAGIELAQQHVAQSDVAVLVFDSSQPWNSADQSLFDEHRQAFVIHNKADLPRSPGRRPEGIYVSAATGEGIDQLPRRIADRLVPNPPPPGAAVPFTEDQIARLRSSLQNAPRE